MALKRVEVWDLWVGDAAERDVTTFPNPEEGLLYAERDNNYDLYQVLDGDWRQIGGGGGGASDVDDLTTDTGLALQFVRVNAGATGLEYRTPVQVLTDIGAAADADLQDHLADLANPHVVTIAQIGAAADVDLSAHIADVANPHVVTAAQAGALAIANNLSDLNDPVVARTNLGVAIGSDVQAWDAGLDDLAGLTPTKGNLIVGDGTNWLGLAVGATDGHVLTIDATEPSGVKWAAAAGGGGSPGGAEGEIQYHGAGAVFAGDAALAFNATTKETTLTGQLTVNRAAGAIELLAEFKVDDALDDYLRIQNVTSTAGRFIPSIVGQSDSNSTNVPLFLMGRVSAANDTGTIPVVVIDSRQAAAALAVRPILDVRSFGNSKLTVAANGNLTVTSAPTGHLFTYLVAPDDGASVVRLGFGDTVDPDAFYIQWNQSGNTLDFSAPFLTSYMSADEDGIVTFSGGVTINQQPLAFIGGSFQFWDSFPIDMMYTWSYNGTSNYLQLLDWSGASFENRWTMHDGAGMDWENKGIFSVARTAATGALDYALEVSIDHSFTNADIDVMKLIRTVTGTPAIGVGANIRVAIENASSVVKDALYIRTQLTSVTNGAETSKTTFGMIGSGAHNEPLTIDGAGGGRVGVGTTGPVAKLGVSEAQSASLDDFTQAVDRAGVIIQSNYTANSYLPGLFWMTANSNPDRPKAGIYIRTTGTGTYMYLGTSSVYANGITHVVTIDPTGGVGVGTSAPDNELQIHTVTPGGGLTISGSGTNTPGLRFHDGSTWAASTYAAQNAVVLSAGHVITGTAVGDYVVAQKKAFDLVFATNNTYQARLTASGILWFRDTAQVNHGMTTLARTDEFGGIGIAGGTTGGIFVRGFTEATMGAALYGYGTTPITTRTAASIGFLTVGGFQKSGTTVGNSTANANIMAVTTMVGGATRMIAAIDAEGDLHLDATSNINVWDDHDDVALLTGLRASLMPDGHELQHRFSGFVRQARPILERTGVVTYNEDGTHYIAMKRLNMLMIDAIRQLHERIAQLEAR